MLPKADIFIFCIYIIFNFAAAHEEDGAVIVDRHDQSSPTENFCKANEKSGKERQCPNTDSELLWFFLSLFGIITWGAFVRTVLRAWKSTLPYTVILMISGVAFGYGTHIRSACATYSKFTKFARISPKNILYIFLPALIFESAYSMNAHIFKRSLTQILILALPGMLFSALLTGFVCYNIFLNSYHWDYPTSFMYGSIISATDPVAVVAILKELGTSEKLGMLIEGESLLNDGVAILMYEIFRKVVEKEEHILIDIALTLLKISIGGPLFGYAYGYVASKMLSTIFNDAATEITITLFSSYIVYWVGEALGVSGVISVVVLGLTLSADSTSISPEVQTLAHHFWELVGYLANTVLFFMVGIILSETAIDQIDKDDWIHLIFLYINLTVIRFTVLMILMPWLTRTGYGIHWKDMVVCSWGGLRGAVGLALSLEIFYSSEFCEKPGDKVGPKFLFHTAGIVFLTLLVNGTTCKALMDFLRLTELSLGRIQDMSNALKHILSTRKRAMRQRRSDRYVLDADWETVERFTAITDPYKAQRLKHRRLENGNVDVDSLASLMAISTNTNLETEDMPEPTEFNEEPRMTLLQQSSLQIITIPIDPESEPTTDVLENRAEEGRQRLLKALKVSFWRQYDKGTLSSNSIQVLLGIADKVGDRRLAMIHAHDLKQWTDLHGFAYWFRINIIQRMSWDVPSNDLPPRPTQGWRKPFWNLASKDWFAALIVIVVILNIIPAVWEIVRVARDIQNGELFTFGFLATATVFTLIYLIEFIIKIIGLGFRGYFESKWNWLDAFVLVLAIVDVSFSYAFIYHIINSAANNASSAASIAGKWLRLLKIGRSLRLLKCFMPRFNRYIASKVNENIFYGYDIGKGFVTAVDDVIKFLPQMVDHDKVLHQLDKSLRRERLETIRLLGLIEFHHPAIVAAVKTRHASRSVLNRMRDTIFELKEDGLLDPNEADVLLTILEKQMKSLWFSPPTVIPNPHHVTFSNIVWLHGQTIIFDEIKKHATLINFNEGDTICKVDDPPTGIYVIVKGMVKAHFVPTLLIVEAKNSRGQLPNVELFEDMNFNYEETDYLTSGYVIGEIGLMTKQPSACRLKCETPVTLYHIPMEQMEAVLKMFNSPENNLEARIWRSIGLRMAIAILATEPEYQAQTLDKIKQKLENSTVPMDLDKELPEDTSDLILLQGQIMDANTLVVYTAPYVLPQSCRRLRKVAGSPVTPRYLVVVKGETEDVEDAAEDLDSNMGSRSRSASVMEEMSTKSV